MMKIIGLLLMSFGLLDLVLQFFWSYDIWYDFIRVTVANEMRPLMAPSFLVTGGAALYLDNMVG